MSDLLVAVTGWDPDAWAAALRARFPDRTVHATGRDGTLRAPASALGNVRYLLGWKPDPALFQLLPKLEVVFSLGAGVDHLLEHPPPEHLPVVRIVDEDLTGRMVEYVVWRVLDHQRRGAAYRAQQAAGIWRDLPAPAAREVTVGIMGFGVIGRAAAAVLVGLGFSVRGWSRTPKTVAGVTCYAGPDGLAPFLAGTDILVALMPLTPETRGILNDGLFRKLKPDGPLGGPVLVNAGRGGSQVEADIVRALDDGTLAAASLDVFETEPLPAESPLWAHPAVTVTPHNAGFSSPRQLSEQIAAQIAAYERGEPLHNTIDRKRGY